MRPKEQELIKIFKNNSEEAN